MRSRAALRNRIRHLHDILRHTYGTPVREAAGDPLDELVQTILSQNTTDANSGAAFRRLKQQFPTWEAVAAARPEAIAAAIRGGGLANIKARRIRDILREIRHRRGQLSLDFLRDLTPAAATEFLRSFKGVGAKTAACVLLFACGMPVFPVDTHIHRVARRLGLIGERTDREAAHEELGRSVPADLTYPFHLLMIEHGRRVCHARRPECSICPLLRLCPTGRRQARTTSSTSCYKPVTVCAVGWGENGGGRASARVSSAHRSRPAAR